MTHQAEVDLCQAICYSDDPPNALAVNGQAGASLVDLRESLANDRRIGRLQEIQLPVAAITSVHGLLFDFDPDLLRPGNGIFEPHPDAREFFSGIAPVLDRHPLARRAEVRTSGRGLHVIVRVEPALQLYTAADQMRWSGGIKAIQRTLPVDPRQPGITAVTRPLG